MRIGSERCIDFNAYIFCTDSILDLKEGSVCFVEAVNGESVPVIRSMREL